MKGALEFLKTTVIGGLFVLLFCLLLAQALPMVIALAEPLALLLPEGALDQAKAKVLMALILIVVSSFLIGLALRLAAGRRLGAWVEGNLLMRLPSYAVVKRLVRGVPGDTEGGAFKPALLFSQTEVRGAPPNVQPRRRCDARLQHFSSGGRLLGQDPGAVHSRRHLSDPRKAFILSESGPMLCSGSRRTPDPDKKNTPQP